MFLMFALRRNDVLLPVADLGDSLGNEKVRTVWPIYRNRRKWSRSRRRGSPTRQLRAGNSLAQPFELCGGVLVKRGCYLVKPGE